MNESINTERTRITSISVSRLYNLGSYEHVKYELSAIVGPGDSAADVLLGLEKIMTALAPISKACVKADFELRQEKRRIDQMKADLAADGPDEFIRKHSHFVGTPEEYIRRCEKGWRADVVKREAWDTNAAKARALLDSLGGAAVWKDAKLDWEDNNYNDDY